MNSNQISNVLLNRANGELFSKLKRFFSVFGPRFLHFLQICQNEMSHFLRMALTKTRFNLYKCNSNFSTLESENDETEGDLTHARQMLSQRLRYAMI